MDFQGFTVDFQGFQVWRLGLFRSVWKLCRLSRSGKVDFQDFQVWDPGKPRFQLWNPRKSTFPDVENLLGGSGGLSK